MIGRTYMAMVLDRSGSMDRIRRQVIEGFNKQIDSLKSEKFGEVYVSLYTFNRNYREEYFSRPIERVGLLKDEQYKPIGDTAFYETGNYVLDRLEQATDINSELNAYLVNFLSDGRDTVSVAGARMRLNSRIRAYQEPSNNAPSRWTFAFLGANQTPLEVHEQLGIHLGNIASFQATPIGGGQHANSVRIKNYTKLRSLGGSSTSNFYE